ncbi:MAG: VOC family protein [Kofleriaceae bacterium]
MSASSGGHRHHAIDYLEFLAPDLTAVKEFYHSAFGWTFTDYGDDYCGFSDGRTHDGAPLESGGIARGAPVQGGPLVVLYSSALEATRDAVAKAGGKITKDIFAFPGGRRFEFEDPAGNRLAAWSH